MTQDQPKAISVRSISKVFGSFLSPKPVKALQDVDLDVHTGEIFGLLGPNGAGKTTLVKILLSIVRPTRGEALLFGKPAHATDARKQIGFLPENHRFPDFLSAFQMLDLYGRLGGIDSVLRKKRIDQYLELVGMTEWAHTRIKKFSKGMMQRVGIAQAMMNDPQLIFLDEPTDGVDPIGRREIRDILMDLQIQGKTIFLNSHLLSELEQVCTRVAILNHGKRVFEGSLDTLNKGESVEIHVDSMDETLHTACQAFFSPDSLSFTRLSDGKTRIELTGAGLEIQNNLIDWLRDKKLLIDTITRHQTSLEDYFIDVVRTNNQETAP